MNKSFWIAVVLITIILGIASGIFVHIYGNYKREKATLEHIRKLNELVEENKIVEASTESETKTTPNTQVVLETYYNGCGHSVIKKNNIDNEDINKNEEQIKEKYKEWNLKKFSSDEISLYREVDKICDDHYIVKESNGNIVVYSINENGEEVLKDKTDISTKYLPEVDQELLKKGIKANSSTKLAEILSDYE